MDKGGYHGGSTIIGPGSGWFGTSQPATKKKKKKKPTSTPQGSSGGSALQAAKNAAAAARADADRAALHARRAVAAADAAEQLAIAKAEKVRRMETGAAAPVSVKPPSTSSKAPTPLKAAPKPKPIKKSESEAERLARANYRKNETATRDAIEVQRVRGAKVITERRGLSGLDVPVKSARKEP
jgi:hypothetical protein